MAMVSKAAVFHLVLLPLLSKMILPFSSLALNQDFCVADRLLPDTPSGYPCKPKALVVSDDFYSGALAKPCQMVNPFNILLATANVENCPGLNGLGISATRVDIHPGGVVPMHTHPEASELIFVVEGDIIAGFVSTETNKVYIKTLNKGDIFVFPEGLIHFQYPIGNSTATIFAAYSNQNPGLQITDFALFRNTLPADVVTKLTFIIRAEVERLKRLFVDASLP